MTLDANSIVAIVELAVYGRSPCRSWSAAVTDSVVVMGRLSWLRCIARTAADQSPQQLALQPHTLPHPEYGAACQLTTIANPDTTGLATAAIVLKNLGLTPLLLATLGINATEVVWPLPVRLDNSDNLPPCLVEDTVIQQAAQAYSSIGSGNRCVFYQQKHPST